MESIIEQKQIHSKSALRQEPQGSYLSISKILVLSKDVVVRRAHK